MGIFGGGKKTKSKSNVDSTTSFDRFDPLAFSVSGSNDTRRLKVKNNNGQLEVNADVSDREQEQGFARFRNTNSNQIGRLEETIKSLRGGNSAFVNARVNPLKESIAEQRGGINRSISRRGVSGSLANNEVSRFNEGADRQIGDATAQAEFEGLSAALGAEGQLAGLNQNEITLADSILKRRLAELGISLEALGLSQRNQQFVKSQRSTGTQSSSSSTSSSPGLGGLISAASGIAGGFGV